MSTAPLGLETAGQLFSTEFQIAYQGMQQLQGTTMERHGTQGTILNVPVIDKIETSVGTFAPANIPVTNVNKRNVQVEQVPYPVKTVIGYGEKGLFFYDEIKAYAQAHAKAVARRVDAIKIAALYAGSIAPAAFTNQVAVDIGLNTGVNQAKLTTGLSLLEAAGVDTSGSQVSCWMPAVLTTGFYADDRVVNLFYSNDRPLQDNVFPNYLGISFRKMPNQSAGINYIPYTLTGATKNYYVPLVHRDALCAAFNVDPMTTITYVEQELRWELVSYVVGGATVVQEEGIVMMRADDPAVVNT